jgi:hypothetical protein
VRADWEARAAARRAALLSLLSRARADLVEVSTDGDVAEPLVRCFRLRARRGGRR